MRRTVAVLMLWAMVACSPVQQLPPAAMAMQRKLMDADAGLASVAQPPGALTALRAASSDSGFMTDAQTAERLFDFAEVFFSQYFPAGPGTEVEGLWTYRHYSQTSIYLGVNAGAVYVMGGPFGTAPVSVGAVSDFAVTSGEVASIRALPLPPTITAGEFQLLRAVPLDAAGKVIVGAALDWTTSTPEKARVIRSRWAGLLGQGEVSLAASSGSHVATVSGTVNAPQMQGRQVAITFGPEETVFHWDTDRCWDGDAPDTNAHALRLADGSLVLVSGNDPRTYVSVGRDFNSLARRCSPAALVSVIDPEPSSFQNRQWITGVYRTGDVIHALVHNEYHDPVAPNCSPGNNTAGNPCNYTSVTYMFSLDGGTTFRKPSGEYVVAAPAKRWDGNDAAMRATPFGYFLPSSIVRKDDGYYYALIYSIVNLSNPSDRGLCLIRTNDLGSAESWRAWNGTDFTLRLANPYLQDQDVPRCKIVTRASAQGSLVYNTFLQQFVIIGAGEESTDGKRRCGFHFWISPDLIKWSEPQYGAPVYLPQFHCRTDGPCPPAQGNLGADVYGAMIDHESASPNFETAGQMPHLYFSRYNAAFDDRSRDLIRRPMIILKSPAFNGDIDPPRMSLGVPADAVLTGTQANIFGWAFDSGGLAKVEIRVDDAVAGSATLGIPRPGVAEAVEGAPPDAGYQFMLDTTRYSNGPHQLFATATDRVGNARTMSVAVRVSN